MEQFLDIELLAKYIISEKIVKTKRRKKFYASKGKKRQRDVYLFKKVAGGGMEYCEIAMTFVYP